MKDNELIIALNKGDLTAFRQLYSEYYIPLCVYANHFTKRKDIAEEIVQDVFLNIWEQREQLRIISSLKAYLFTSTRNQCLNHLKHLQVVMEYNDYYTQLLKDAQDYYIISQESGDSIMIANELEQSLKEAIDLLPDGCRKVFLMSRFDGLKHKDIAEKLGITLNTVDKQMSIAISKLKESLRSIIVTLLLAFFYIILL